EWTRFSANTAMINRFLTYADKLRLGIIGLALAVLSIAQLFAPLPIEWASFGQPFFLIGALAAVGLAYRRLNRDEGIAAACFVVAQILLFSNFAVLDNYLGLALHRPLIDEFLAAADRRAGIDWWAYVNWIKSDPFFGRILAFAYISTVWQLAAAILFLGFTRRFDRLDRLTLAFMLAGAVSIGFWAIFPNLGALPLHYAHGLPGPTFTLVMSKEEAMQQLALFSGPVPVLRFSSLMGIIGCPSFHTVMAVLTVEALWPIPLAGILSLACNIVVLLSVPADGGHHFVDVGAGILVSFASLALARALLAREAGESPRHLPAWRALLLLRRVLSPAKP
ncbi:MAG: phosphatase PAP2 family protein, partial [Methylocapsa sp.]|nr:phosphatase PAP2 family protein [Methylocapsa sp.]